MSSDEGNSPDAIQLCCEVIIQLSTDHMIHDVMMTVQTNQPLVVHPCVFQWNEMGNVCLCVCVCVHACMCVCVCVCDCVCVLNLLRTSLST